MTGGVRLKACPVVLRGTDCVEVLAFEHPLAGLQLVKGSVEDGETAAQAAVRELREESGVVAHVVADLGTWDAEFEQQRWSLHLCEAAAPLAEEWVHQAVGDAGHAYRFFWHPLEQAPSESWHDVYRRALGRIWQVLRETRVLVSASVASSAFLGDSPSMGPRLRGNDEAARDDGIAG